MKIVSQLSNAVPDATNKSTSIDTGKSNFQSTFAASIGSTVGAPEKTVEPGPGKGQGVDAKKSSNSDSKKKSSSSSPADGTITTQVPDDSLQLLAIAPPVPVNTVPQARESAASVTPANGAGEQLVVTGAVAVAGDKSDAAPIAATRVEFLPVLDTAPVRPSAENVAANDSNVSDHSAELMPKSIPTSAVAWVPKTKAPDAADGTILDAAGGGSQLRDAASAETDAKSGIAATDASPLSTFSLAVAVPHSLSQQDISATSAGSNTWDFKVPAARTDASAPAGGITGSGSGKGKAASTRTYGSTEEKQTATGADSESTKARTGAAEVISKDVPGGAGEPAQGTALAQSTHASMLSAPTHSVDAQGTATQSVSTAASSAAPTLPASAENVQAAHALSSAQLIQSAHGSEMRLGMQSAEFGSISITTSLNHQALSAQISIDHSALGHALAAHLPAIEEKLGSAYGIQARVELRDTGSRSSFNDSSSQESKGNRQSQTGDTGRSTAALQSSIGVLTSSTYTSMPATSARLDIRI